MSTIPCIHIDQPQWHSLHVSADECNIAISLNNGQTFCWYNIDNQYHGVIQSTVYAIREYNKAVQYAILYSADTSIDHYQVLIDYFNLQLPFHISALYKQWSVADNRFDKIASLLPGIRLLQQHPLECTMSFICSSNNNIVRIKQMIYKLRQHYGTPLCTVQYNNQLHTYYIFPTLQQLSNATESQLRVLGFGYRAKFICASTETLIKLGGVNYLNELKHSDISTAECESSLESNLTGVGRKVASCIALFSLNRYDSVPVDTHVYDIAVRDYDIKPINTKSKSINKSIYAQIQECFRMRFGEHCGWAHSILFTAELKLFRDELPQLQSNKRSRDTLKLQHNIDTVTIIKQYKQNKTLHYNATDIIKTELQTD